LGKKARETVFANYEISARVKELEQIWSAMAGKA